MPMPPEPVKTSVQRYWPAPATRPMPKRLPWGARGIAVKLRPAEMVVLAAAALIVAWAGLVGVLIYSKPPPVRFTYRESAPARVGEMIFRREGCLSCHALFGNGTGYGPALDGVGSRRNGVWLKEYLRSPRPGVGDRSYRLRMPAYDTLEAGELDALVTYLAALREFDADGRVIDPR